MERLARGAEGSRQTASLAERDVVRERGCVVRLRRRSRRQPHVLDLRSHALVGGRVSLFPTSFTCVIQPVSWPPPCCHHLPPLSDHLALTSALIVNEISLSLLKFLRLILLLLLPLLILSPLNNTSSPPLLGETRIPAFLAHIASLSFPLSPLSRSPTLLF